MTNLSRTETEIKKCRARVQVQSALRPQPTLALTWMFYYVIKRTCSAAQCQKYIHHKLCTKTHLLYTNTPFICTKKTKQNSMLDKTLCICMLKDTTCSVASLQNIVKSADPNGPLGLTYLYKRQMSSVYKTKPSQLFHCQDRKVIDSHFCCLEIIFEIKTMKCISSLRFLYCDLWHYFYDK